MHTENIHHIKDNNTVVNVGNPTLGYIHNEWLLYYAFGNCLRLAHFSYKDTSWLYFSLPNLTTLQCKPLSLSLSNIPLTFKHRILPSLSTLSFSFQTTQERTSEHSRTNNNNTTDPEEPLFSQPITCLYIISRA
jgi:hypothetical protein